MPHYNQFDSSAMEPQHDIKGVHDGYMVRTPRGPYRIWFGEVGADHGDSSDDAKQRVWDAACQRSDAQDDPERMMDFDDISDESMGALYGGRGWGVTGFRVFTLGGPIDIDLTEEEQVAFPFHGRRRRGQGRGHHAGCQEARVWRTYRRVAACVENALT